MENKLLPHLIAYLLKKEKKRGIRKILKQDPEYLRKYSPSQQAYSLLKKWQREYHLIPFYSPIYPPSLLLLSDFPLLLFAKGKLSLLKKEIYTIVGTRRASPAGKSLAFILAKTLAQKGYTILSGMAEGIDFYAHKGSLLYQRSIGIPAHGLGYIPPRKSSLFLEMEKKALLLSEFLPEEKMKRYYPPLRNRLLARLAKAIFLIEAPPKSGSLITASYARKYQIPLYAFSFPFLLQNQGGETLIQKEVAQDISSLVQIEKGISSTSSTFLYQNTYYTIKEIIFP